MTNQKEKNTGWNSYGDRCEGNIYQDTTMLTIASKTIYKKNSPNLGRFTKDH